MRDPDRSVTENTVGEKERRSRLGFVEENIRGRELGFEDFQQLN